MQRKQKHGIRSDVEDATAELEPIFEFDENQKERIRTFAGAALSILAAAGAVAVTAAAPNLFSAIGKIARTMKGRSYSFKEKQQKTSQTFYYLKRHGLIRMYETDAGWVARLTKRGKQEVEKLHLATVRVKPGKKWDRSFWLVAADIPTEHKRAADLFRRKLKYMGFYPLQRTLWLYPYNPVAEIQFLIDHFQISKFVTVMGVNRLDHQDEKKLKKFFAL